MLPLSASEWELIADRQFFLAKARIMEKLHQQLEALRERLRAMLMGVPLLAPAGLDVERGQITRGERYHDLPFLYLDFPKFFSRTDKFTYRSLFWWGQSFVFALILQGPYLPIYKSRILGGLSYLAGQGYFLSTAVDPWEWRREGAPLLPLEPHHPGEEEVLRQAVERLGFLKIERFVDFDHPGLREEGVVGEGVRTFQGLQFIVQADGAEGS